MTAAQSHQINIDHRWENLAVAAIYNHWLNDPSLADSLPPPPLPGTISTEAQLCDFIAAHWS